MAEPKRSVEPNPAPVPGGIAARALGARGAAYLADLNPEQREAVLALDGPVLVLAGAIFFLLSFWEINITPLLASAGIAGIGRENLRQIEVDAVYAMRPDALERAIAADRAAGHTPFFVSATVGTTSSTAMDPLRAIGEICRRHGLWLHVDAALAGSAAVCPEFRWIHDGLELADSYCFNPHKWLLTNFDCDCFYVADRAALIRTLTILPEYLRNQATESGAVLDYRDWGIPLGRRFRALKLWFVMRSYGLEGLRRHIRHHVALAQRFAEWVQGDARFEIVAPAPLNLVCFRLRADDGPNERLLARVNASGRVYLTHTRLAGRFTLRLAVGATYTTAEHVEAAWHRIQEAATEQGGG